MKIIETSAAQDSHLFNDKLDDHQMKTKTTRIQDLLHLQCLLEKIQKAQIQKEGCYEQ